MSYTVKLAIFPPWKAPVPFETLGEVFATTADASKAAASALAPITEREHDGLVSCLQPRSERAGEQWVTAVAVPEVSVRGYVIYDEAGAEVGNWTALDVAVERAAKFR